VIFVVFAVPELSWGYPQWLLNIVGIVCVLSAIGPLVKSVALNWGVTTNSPLAAEVNSTFTDKCLSNFNIPTFATLSCFRPQVNEADFWDGWVPRYVRLNGLAGDSVRKILLQSAGLPGIFPERTVLGQKAIDGGWCDNVPIAPLLYGTKEKLDLIFVIYLNESERYPRLKRGLRSTEKPFTRDMTTGLLDMNDEAEFNWRIHEYAQGLGNKPDFDKFYCGYSGRERPYDPNLPHIVPVVPSRSLGNFFTGTLNFSQKKATELIEEGVKDMDDVLANLLEKEWKTFDRDVRTLERKNCKVWFNSEEVAQPISKPSPFKLDIDVANTQGRKELEKTKEELADTKQKLVAKNKELREELRQLQHRLASAQQRERKADSRQLDERDFPN
jgi:hypothetical protein